MGGYNRSITFQTLETLSGSFRREDTPFILRLTDPIYRTLIECRAEIAYLNHLIHADVRVAAPVASQGGNVVEEITTEDETMLASVFCYAPGERVTTSSEHWNERLFVEWGQTLGQIHAASQTFTASIEGDRWNWQDEVFLAQARNLISTTDSLSLKELDAILAFLHQLPTDTHLFGMTHGDFAPQNFHYHPDFSITTFDFGNCCYHWYISDLAISLSVIRHLPERDRLRNLIFTGYEQHHPIDPDLLANIDWFFRLRTLYVYLSRLMKFGSEPTDEEQKILLQMQRNVHKEFAW